MPKINCGVESCSYNHNHYCCASVVNVGGKGAVSTNATCCGTFLNKLGYSNIAQYTNVRGELDAILCRVDTCAYHKDEHCTLNEIEVDSLNKEAEIYTETDCLSFEKK